MQDACTEDQHVLNILMDVKNCIVKMKDKD